ncbi:HIR complex subunit [Saxophila tyrrhenica]|uniref:Protein HIR n=1 Tax=Saxophila tyrrhenica TaxID=1690608 RepID=A0AAV9P6X9_9PEZI|nr:HIR complex subunit [Saxophila tyrrhenica]
MRFTKPNWLGHHDEKKDHEVYSCHVSPDASRLATAAGDGHVRIWSTEAILNASNPSYTKPRQLASLSIHSGTVHSVRFSPNGKHLASGGDDKFVIVYHIEPGKPQHSTFGSKEEQPVENWRVFRRMIGHDNDVQDLGWSYDSSILVSVGLDSKVVVWSGSTFEKLKTLPQHQSHVKGITFDPANKFFATASDDRTIKVYRFTSPPPNASAQDQTSNFVLESSITDPFKTSPLTTYFRRPSWSPDGNHIAAANATNGPVSSVAIIQRGKWDIPVNLIGHEGPVEVCAFSPRLFTKDPYISDQATGTGITIIACAGQDRTLSVWNTSFPRPFVTTAELAAKSITDLSWSPDGQTLYLTSLDGTIAAVVFEKGELGYPRAVAQNDKMLEKYGGGRKMGIVENTDALRLEDSSKAGELDGVRERMGELMGEQSGSGAGKDGVDAVMADSTTAVATTNGVAPHEPAQVSPPKDAQAERVEKLKQRVTITKDGKKRIAPLLVSSSNQGEANMPRPQLQAAARNGMGSDEPAGKVLDLSKPYDGLPKGGLASLLLGNKRKYAEVDGADGDEDGRRRNEKRVQAMQQTGATPIVHNTVDGLVPAAASATDQAQPADIPDVLRPAIINPSLSVSQIRLAVPMVRSVILRPLDPTKTPTEPELNNAEPEPEPNPNSANLVFEARNPAPGTGATRTGRAADREPTRITLSRRSQIIWQDFLPRAALLVTGNKNFWAAGCEDGSLYTWTPAGRRMLNAIVLEAQPVLMDCRGWNVLVVTAVGQVYVFDVRQGKGRHPPVSLAPVLDAASSAVNVGGGLTPSSSLMFARLNSQGVVVVGLSNGDGFAYNADLWCWQRLSEGWWAVGSQYWNTSSSSAAATGRPNANQQAPTGTFLDDIQPENVSAGIIPLLERNTTSQSLVKGRAFFLQRLVKALLSAEGYEGFETAVSVAHLENRVAAAAMLGAKEEFRVYLVMWAKRIGVEGQRAKVEELLRGLAGSMFEDRDAEDGVEEKREPALEWGDGEDVVGWKRQVLLREVVMVLGRQRDLQRVVVPYARALGVLDGEDDGERDEVGIITSG